MMKINNWYFLLPMICLFSACKMDKEIAPSLYDCTANNSFENAQYQQLLDEIVGNGVPGIMMCVYKPDEGAWVGAAGKADLKNNVDLKSCDITRVGSTVKMFTAVTVLQLAEEGKLDLDDRASQYLSTATIKNIENADVATIRQLLHHSSGIYNYIQNLQFQTASLNDLFKEWKPDELLRYARNKSAYFEPGTDVRYSNTNYVLLGEIIEKITGKPFYEVFEEKIFTPLQLNATSFAATDHVPTGIIRGYIDLYSNLNVINATYYSGWDYYTADGGLISNPYDMFVFLKALMEEKVISAPMLEEMMQWKAPKEQDSEFFDIAYGLGIFKMDTPFGEAYFHSGDAIGYYANMLYLPEKQVYIVWAVNGNYGKIDDFTLTKEAIEKIIGDVLKDG
jgi:D-alanyl-D-alanine carboxypeptidase